jgi:hypothetical protein
VKTVRDNIFGVAIDLSGLPELTRQPAEELDLGAVEIAESPWQTMTK